MTRTRSGKSVCLYLSYEAIKILEYSTGAIKDSNSKVADQIICSWYDGSDPIKELKSLEKDEQELQDKEKEIKERKVQVLAKLEHHREFKKLRDQKKQEAIQILKRKIIEGSDAFEIEHIARNWGNRLDIPFQTLLFEAKLLINKESQSGQFYPSR